MIKKLMIFAALSTVTISASAQWTLSSEKVGDREFTEVSAGIYELSLGADTIYGRFILKNGDEIRYGAENTYVCGGVPYRLTTEGDSLMLGSPVVNAVFSLDTSDGTLTVSGNVQPLTLRGNAKGAYWNPFDMLPLNYQGNGIYSCKNLQMNARDFTICMLTAPNTMEFDAAASWLVPYRFSGVTVTASNTLKWGVPENMYIAQRGSTVNFYLPVFTAMVDLTVNLIDVTITATGSYNPPQSDLYVIGADIARGEETIRWTDNGCTKGFAMDRTVVADTVTYTIENLKIRAISTDDDDNVDGTTPQGRIEIASNLGSWKDIQEGYCFCWERNPLIMTLNASNTATCNVRDAGSLIAPLQLPTGTYNLSIRFAPNSAPLLSAIQTDTSGIEGVTVDEIDSNAPVEWFDLSGRKIAQPTDSGVYIRRSGSVSQKVWILAGQ